MLSLRTHNILDYVGGVLLIIAPFLFGFAGIDAARNSLTVAGAVLILYSLFTNYEYAVIRVIPLGIHMTFDVICGIFVACAPWMFSYRDAISPGQEYLHYVLGIAVFCLVGFTRERTESDKRAHNVHVRTATPAAGRV